MHHLYLSYQPSQAALSSEKALLEGWCGKQGIDDYQILEERLTSGRISQKQIARLLSCIEKGDILVVSSLSRLGRSVSMVDTVVNMLVSRGAELFILDEDRMYRCGEDLDGLVAKLDFAAGLASRIRSERNEEALYPARQQGFVQGRPTGSTKQKSKLVLYGKTDSLRSMHEQGLRSGEIAKRLGVSRTTVYNYLATLNK